MYINFVHFKHQKSYGLLVNKQLRKKFDVYQFNECVLYNVLAPVYVINVNQTRNDKEKIMCCSWSNNICSFNKDESLFTLYSADYAVLFCIWFLYLSAIVRPTWKIKPLFIFINLLYCICFIACNFFTFIFY